jgi:hypothetical protein
MGSAIVRETLGKAAKTSDKLAALLCVAGNAEASGELAGRLTRMSDDARVLAGALERLAFRDADRKDREKAEREKAYYARKKTQCDTGAEVPGVPTVESATVVEIASEAAQSAVEQAQRTSLFINWAVPIIEDGSESEVEEGQSL